MGCSASKATEVVVAPMPTKPKIVDTKQNEKDADSLRGSHASLASNSNLSERDSSARSTRTTDTTDSGVGELEDVHDIITEHSSKDEIVKAKVNERPNTPELSIDGTSVQRRKSPKQRLMESRESSSNSLPPLGIIERPKSRAVAFDVVLYPDTGNVKNRPAKLQSLEKRKKRSKRRTKQEIEQKIKEASERRTEHANQVIEKATLSRKERNLREAKALDEFAQRLEQQES